MSKNLIILAGGLNRRYNELSRFSKVTLPFIKDGRVTTCLKNSYELFNDYNRYVIVDSIFYDQVTNYIRANNLEITCIKSTNHVNSYETIYELRTQLPKENLLFIWSDVILDEQPEFTTDTNIIFTKPGNYRYRAQGNLLEECSVNGNVPGLYFLKSISYLDTYKEYSDFVELYSDISFTTNEICGNLFELRDKDTYLSSLKTNKQLSQARYFNSLTRDGDRITKTTDRDHLHLLKKEIDWYYRVNDLGIAPELICNTNDSLTIEYLDGYTNFYKVLNENNKYLIDKLVNELTGLHNISSSVVSDEIIFRDMYNELLAKVVQRVSSVQHMILDYDPTYVTTLLESFKILYLHFKKDNTYYSYFHGDLNGSNTMVKNENFKFIDPRNYFGETVNSGPLFYEIAKVYYCLYGYDDFNANINYIYINKDSYTVPKKLANYEIDPYYLMVVGIIYISLTSYISDNIMKVNIAFQYGLKLLREGLNLINSK